MHPLTLPKQERLARKKLIDTVFSEGKSIKTPALVLVYMTMALPEEVPAQVLVTASKRNFKRAHDRNRIKRLIREAYRKQKHALLEAAKESGTQFALLFIFTGRQLPDQAYVHGRVNELLRKLTQTITAEHTK